MSEEAPPARRASVPLGTVTAAILILGLLVLLGAGVARSQSGPIAVGARAPDFELTTFDGQTMRSQEFHGRPMLINFWASWCQPCEQEAAALQRAWLRMEPQGVQFLGVDYLDIEPKALAYLERFGITYPNGPDLGTRIAQKFHILGVPETFVVNADAIVTFVQIGPFASDDDIQSALETAVAP